jgi:hypothetical protein
MPNKVKINSKLPTPYYLQGQYYNEVAKKGQRTDTVIENEEQTKWAVIDAKYYDASSPQLAPGWHDLVKQFFYKTAAEEICEEGVLVSLHFVFPGTEEILLTAKVGDRNQGRVKESDFSEIDKYSEIHCHYCNPITLLKKYVAGKKLDIELNKDITGTIF